MSKNEDLVRDAFETFNRQQRDDTERFVHPDCELFSPLAEVRGQAYQGIAGAHRWFDDIGETFSSITTDLAELREVRQGRVLGLGHAKAEGRASAIDFERPIGWVVDVEDDLIRRIWIFFDHDEARSAAERN